MAAGGGRWCQRWVKFVKYLSKFGWEPIVVCPDQADYPLIDESLEKEVPSSVQIIKIPIFEPRKVFRKLMGFFGKKQQTGLDQLFYREKKSFFQKFGLWLRANFFIPDARMFWIGPVTKKLYSLIGEEGVDRIITTGPPHSLHIVGLRMKKARPSLKWIADFRDPWMEIEYFDRMPLTSFARRKHARLEKEVLTAADKVITVSPSWAEMFRSKGAGSVHVITNGFDPPDFDVPKANLPSKFRLCHVGTLAMDRNPEMLWDALIALVRDGKLNVQNLEIAFVGQTDHQVIDDLLDTDLAPSVKDYGYVPHERAIQVMMESDLLLLLLNTAAEENTVGRIPGKVFEYLGTGKKVMLIGKTGTDLSKIVQNHDGFVLNQKERIVEVVMHFISTPEKQLSKSTGLGRGEFTREKLSRQLVEILVSA